MADLYCCLMLLLKPEDAPLPVCQRQRSPLVQKWMLLTESTVRGNRKKAYITSEIFLSFLQHLPFQTALELTCSGTCCTESCVWERRFFPGCRPRMGLEPEALSPVPLLCCQQRSSRTVEEKAVTQNAALGSKISSVRCKKSHDDKRKTSIQDLN